jgi:hypothetical protein
MRISRRGLANMAQSILLRVILGTQCLIVLSNDDTVREPLDRTANTLCLAGTYIAHENKNCTINFDINLPRKD